MTLNSAEEADPRSAESDASATRKRRGWHVVIAMGIAVVVMAYLAVAYVLLPLVWSRYEKHHPWLDNVVGLTETKSGIPGDPLNVALIGTEEELKRILAAAAWDSADPLGLRSDLKIAADTVLRKAYGDAPVSNLYLFGRKEDLAFEQPVGGDPRRRHHVRFWRAAQPHSDGRPVWFGSVTYDQRVGLSHTTGQITHHIAPDVDAERDHLLSTLEHAGGLQEQYYIDDFHPVREGHNGGGDPWYTDGRLAVGILQGGATLRS